MQEIFTLVEKVADYGSNILITGETGTGKELVARAIHYSGSSGERPFVTIDCASIPENLLESELFGYAKGAFTGATESKKGQIEMAHGGTLFLDEVGELPLVLQKKLLRFLQEKEFVRVGGTKRRKVDVRILAATNKDLEAEVQAGTWREDLFYRLNVITIHIPPLRERKEDISLLVNFFLDKYNAQNQRSIQGVTNDVHKVFELYEWPGNVRELENVIERGVVLCTGDMITLNCLPPKLAELDKEQDAGNGLNLMEVEKRLIVRALDQEGGNQSAAARTLGISRKQLRTKMTHHGLL
jgi:transcriptional regulator with PAS, ATPase and Fis domain